MQLFQKGKKGPRQRYAGVEVVRVGSGFDRNHGGNSYESEERLVGS